MTDTAAGRSPPSNSSVGPGTMVMHVPLPPAAGRGSCWPLNNSSTRHSHSSPPTPDYTSPEFSSEGFAVKHRHNHALSPGYKAHFLHCSTRFVPTGPCEFVSLVASLRVDGRLSDAQLRHSRSSSFDLSQPWVPYATGSRESRTPRSTAIAVCPLSLRVHVHACTASFGRFPQRSSVLVSDRKPRQSP